MAYLIEVSIIVPNYNKAEFLSECLDSCLNQLSSNQLEVIVVDDGSTDNSLLIAQKYQEEYPSVFKVLINDQKGACSARNLGFSKSIGRHVMFLDSDDILSDLKLNNQLRSLENKENSVSLTSWCHFEEHASCKNAIQQIDKTYSNTFEFMCDCWFGKGMTVPGCWLIPRNVALKAGEWNTRLLKNQDGEYISRVLCVSDSIEFVREGILYYRKPKNSSNISKRKTRSDIRSLLLSYKLYENVLGHSDTKTIRRALSRNYSRFIYENYDNQSELCLVAFTHIRALGCTIEPLFRSSLINRLSKVIGILNVYKLRKCYNNIRQLE